MCDSHWKRRKCFKVLGYKHFCKHIPSKQTNTDCQVRSHTLTQTLVEHVCIEFSDCPFKNSEMGLEYNREIQNRRLCLICRYLIRRAMAYFYLCRWKSIVSCSFTKVTTFYWCISLSFFTWFWSPDKKNIDLVHLSYDFVSNICKMVSFLTSIMQLRWIVFI